MNSANKCYGNLHIMNGGFSRAIRTKRRLFWSKCYAPFLTKKNALLRMLRETARKNGRPSRARTRNFFF